MNSWSVLFVTVLTVLGNNCDCKEESTLQLVLAIFRHGDRTNDKFTIYPRDPYINYTYYPFGYGQLTNVGKQKMYDLGKVLRTRYNDFIDEVYTPDLLYATSSDTSRTKVSLQLVLAGLFPPDSTQLKWNDHLNWLPIPYTYDKEITHRMPFPYCPKYLKLHKAYVETDEVQKTLKVYNKWFPYLAYHTGLKVTSIFELLLVHCHLIIQQQLGMRVPLWSFPLFPHVTGNATVFFFSTFSANSGLKQLLGGPFLKKIIQVMKEKVNGTLYPSDRKLFLYSGHDINLMSTLGALNIDVHEVTPYGTCILIELHKKNKEYFVRIFYRDPTVHELKHLIVRGCTKDCSFNHLLELLQPNLPENDSLCDERNLKEIYTVT